MFEECLRFLLFDVKKIKQKVTGFISTIFSDFSLFQTQLRKELNEEKFKNEVLSRYAFKPSKQAGTFFMSLEHCKYLIIMNHF